MGQSAKSRPIVFYIRHGETDWNVTGRLQGRHDVPLNARGRAPYAEGDAVWLSWPADAGILLTS